MKVDIASIAWPPSLQPHVARAADLLDAPSGTMVVLSDGTTFTPIEVVNAAGDDRWIVRRTRVATSVPKNLEPLRAVGEIAMLLKMGVSVRTG